MPKNIKLSDARLIVFIGYYNSLIELLPRAYQNVDLLIRLIEAFFWCGIEQMIDDHRILLNTWEQCLRIPDPLTWIDNQSHYRFYHAVREIALATKPHDKSNYEYEESVHNRGFDWDNPDVSIRPLRDETNVPCEIEWMLLSHHFVSIKGFGYLYATLSDNKNIRFNEHQTMLRHITWGVLAWECDVESRMKMLDQLAAIAQKKPVWARFISDSWMYAVGAGVTGVITPNLLHALESNGCEVNAQKLWMLDESDLDAVKLNVDGKETKDVTHA